MNPKLKFSLFIIIGLLILSNVFLLVSNGTSNENSVSYQRVNNVMKNRSYDFAGENASQSFDAST